MITMTDAQEKFISGLEAPYLRQDGQSGAISAVDFINHDVVLYEVEVDGHVRMQQADGYIQGWIDIY